jgi:hypothetical protein
MVILYHWALRSRRRSIEREGLRRCSWNGGALVLYAVSKKGRLALREHIADRHDVEPGQLDLWRFHVARGDASRRAGSVYQVRVDLPPECVERVLTMTDFRGVSL